MGNEPIKFFYQGKNSDFIIFVESESLVDKFKKGDTSIPLIDIVSIYKIFSTRTGGVEGVLDEASKNEISNEFGTSDIDEAIKKILREGSSKQGGGDLNKKGWRSQNDADGAGATGN